MSHVSRGVRAEFGHQLARDLDRARGRRGPCRPRSGSRGSAPACPPCARHRRAAARRPVRTRARCTSTAPTFGCPQYAASVSCVVCMSGPSWPQPGGVRQRRADRRDRRGDALGDDRRADHGRHHQQVVADADAAVGPAVALEREAAFALTGSPFRRAARRSGRRSPLESWRREVAASARARHVVRVHVRAGGDVGRRDADRAAVLHDRARRRRSPAPRPCGRAESASRTVIDADLRQHAAGLERFERGRDVVGVADDDAPGFTG